MIPSPLAGRKEEARGYNGNRERERERERGRERERERSKVGSKQTNRNAGSSPTVINDHFVVILSPIK